MALSLQDKIHAAGYGTLGGCILMPDTEYATALEGNVIAETLTLTYERLAPWDTANRFPVTGDKWALGNIAGDNSLPDWTVQSSRITQDGSPAITTRVVVTLRHDTITYVSVPELDPTADEVTWAREERPVATHPHFAGADFTLFAKWEQATNDERATLEASATGVTAELIGFMKKGVTAYAFYSPIVSRTTRSADPIASGGAGMRSTPPHSSGLAAQWLKTASHASRTGRSGTWELREEWTGAVAWDSTLYP